MNTILLASIITVAIIILLMAIVYCAIECPWVDYVLPVAGTLFLFFVIFKTVMIFLS